MRDLLSERFVLVLTGISASGKSTIAELLARRFAKGVTFVEMSSGRWSFRAERK
jgi:adenylylsulfate kinase-like enzyme